MSRSPIWCMAFVPAQELSGIVCEREHSCRLCSQKPNRKVGLLFTHIRMVIDFNDEPYPKTGTTKQGLSGRGGK